MAQARTAVSAGVCPGLRDAGCTSPGVSTADGVSWLTTARNAVVGYGHDYLVQEDDRVALPRVDQLGADEIGSTAGDPAVLHNLVAALSR